MLYTFSIPQAGTVRAGLLGKVDLRELCLLDFISRWANCDSAKRITIDGVNFRWLDSGNAIEELPLLFEPGASPKTRSNQLSALLNNLRRAGLVSSVRVGGKLYARHTALAEGLRSSTAKLLPDSAPAIPPKRDELIPSGRDELIPEKRDENRSPISIETGTKETGTKETAAAAAAAVVELWNSFCNLPKVRQLTPSRAKKLGQRLNDPFFTEHWQAGIARAAASAFCTGQGSSGWKANLDWFLRPDSLTKLLEGDYDGPIRRSTAPQKTPPRSPVFQVNQSECQTSVS
jgi:hypothetical protein